VVSNRVSVPKDGASKAGGLTVALEGALKQSGGLWFGWSGETVESPSDQAKVSQSGNITFAVLDLSQQDYDEYYAGFANRALWPSATTGSISCKSSGRSSMGIFGSTEPLRPLSPRCCGPTT
jgi:trehalose-6-phosphate synthase